MVGNKIYLVQQESNVDGEITFNVIPCSSLEKAKEVLEKEKKWVKNEAYHFQNYTEEELEEEFEIEESETRWYINDPSDDYYEEITIVEKEIE